VGSIVKYGMPPMCKRVPAGMVQLGATLETIDMALYFLEYDLIKQKNYDALYTALQQFGAHRHLLSAWSFKYANSGASVSLRDHFQQFMDADDRLVVSEVVDWASNNALAAPHRTA